MTTGLTLSSKQLHQLLHVAVPELYQAALSGERVWLTLWSRGERVKGSEPQKVSFHMTEDRNYLEICTDYVSWTMRRDVKSQPIVGVALGQAAHPVHFEAHRNVSSLLKRDTLKTRFSATIRA